MNKIQQLIIDTYQSKPKHFTQILGRNKEVVNYVNEITYNLNMPTFLEKLYYAVYNENNICKKGNIKKLKTFDGYSFCGKTGVCDCAKESVSQSISSTIKCRTKEEKDKINKKRNETTLLLHGVINNGQTKTAKEAHSDFYKDEIKVTEVTQQIKDTKLTNYNDENYNNRSKAEKTCLEKYGVKNTWSLTDEKQNPNLDILRDKDKLSELFPRLSVEEIALQTGLHAQTIYYYLNKHGLRTQYKSTFEQEIIFYLNSLGIINIITNKRTIIGKELDIFLPDYSLAIEYNGIYWHHDKIPHITKTYHYDKFISCEKLGIELLTIFSNSWNDNKEIWKTKIRNKLQLNIESVYARKTEIIEITSKDTIEILNNNHIQGYCPGEICYGLYYNSELVAAMTFSKKRFSIGKDRGEKSYELVRYVSSKRVIGGASKLLNHFINAQKPELIYSYSNNQYSSGKLYKILNFKLENEYKCNYWYYHPKEKKNYHRSNFSKYKLVKAGFDSSKTEFQIMDERGFLRIWDCGSRTWILDCKK